MMKAKYIIAAALAAVTLNSCSDMFSDGSDRYVYDPQLTNKVDSMFYINAMLKGVQQCIDQNVLINELRGDLVVTTPSASTDLKNLADFNTDASNKYTDSAYVYYRIINNCNYYIAHRDTTIMTGSTAVAMKEYAQAKAIRAWTYLQLCRNYGRVPFYTTPLTTIEDVENAADLEKKDINEITAILAPDLEQYVDQPVPSWGTFDAGTTDAGSSKTVTTSMMMFPIHLVLGDLYLETNQYAKAAENYFQYLRKNKKQCKGYIASVMNYPDISSLPSALIGGGSSTGAGGTSWSQIFQSDAETITLVAMASNKMRGTTTELPGLFGYNFYTSADSKTYSDSPSLEASPTYLQLSNSQNYCYRTGSDSRNYDYKSTAAGDMRWYSTYYGYNSDKSSDELKIIMKYRNANVQIYRTGGVILKLAEAINRMGYPRVAFAALKDGWNSTLEKDTSYIRTEDLQFLKSTVPFLTDANKVIFNDETDASSTAMISQKGCQPIHARGCGYTQGAANKAYSYTGMVWDSKVKELKDQSFYQMPTTASDSLKAEIDAVEDLICDEMALELAFEGSRYGDLLRFARHKNNAAFSGSNYGTQWLSNKIRQAKGVALTEDKWYLNFK